MPAPKKYDAETQARAVRMFADRMAEGDVSQLAARREVGELLGIKQETLRNWICGSPRIVEGFSMRLPGRGPRCSRS